MTVYAAPTTEGVATVACVIPPAAGSPTSRPSASGWPRTLDALRRRSRSRSGPGEDYARAAGAALRSSIPPSRAPAERLRDASTPAAQAAAATDLAAAYAAAARALSRAPGRAA